jgi:hypothetical protein
MRRVGCVALLAADGDRGYHSGGAQAGERVVHVALGVAARTCEGLRGDAWSVDAQQDPDNLGTWRAAPSVPTPPRPTRRAAHPARG